VILICGEYNLLYGEEDPSIISGDTGNYYKSWKPRAQENPGDENLEKWVERY